MKFKKKDEKPQVTTKKQILIKADSAFWFRIVILIFQQQEMDLYRMEMLQEKSWRVDHVSLNAEVP